MTGEADAAAIGTLRTLACPSCAAVITHDRAFSPWCEACDWNLATEGIVRVPKSRIDQTYRALGQRAGESLYREQLTAHLRRPRFTAGRAVAYAISGTVLLVAAAIVAAGLALIVLGGNIAWTLVGLVLIGLVVYGRPRPVATPTNVVPRARAPELHAVLDEIAATIKAPRVEVIGVDADWNATTYRSGFRRRLTIVIGLPLLQSLDPNERLAILAHEVGHSVDGDGTRTLVVWTAILTLDRWIQLIVPESLTSDDNGLVGLATIPINLIFLAIAYVLFFVLRLLLALLFRDSQRSEFYADDLAGDVAGTSAAASALGRLRLYPAYRRARSLVTTTGRPTELFDALARQIALTPASELDRQARLERIGADPLDATHPPTYQRIGVLESHAHGEARLVVAPERWARIDAELAPYRQVVTVELTPDD